MTGNGGLLRWDGTSNSLTAMPVSAVSPNTVTADWDSFRAWYPGIKQGRFQVSNTSRGADQPWRCRRQTGFGVGLLVRTELGRCPGVPDNGDHDMTAGQTSARYTMGAYTAGSDGNCAATTTPTSGAAIWWSPR